MGKKVAIAALGLGAAGAAALYLFRRPLIARAMGLRPARYDVRVTRGIRITMPDGATLAADHYTPKRPGTYPAVLIRTPYGRKVIAMEFVVRRFAERGYHVIIQDTRGRFDSDGVFQPLRNEATDGQATLAWIARQTWFSGVLGMWGPSYLGYVQWAVAADAPGYLKALVPIVTGSQFVTLSHPDGAFGFDTLLRWTTSVVARSSLRAFLQYSVFQDRLVEPAFRHLPLQETDVVATGGAVPFYREWLAHPDRDDPYWRPTDHSAEVPRVTAPAHIIAGWYDILLRESLADYAALAAAGRAPYLTVGPWTHLSPGHAIESIRAGLDWFDAQLKGEPGCVRARGVRVYVMGSGVWREFDTWPPATQDERYFLHAAGLLSPGTPPHETPPDHFVYDPANPTPAVGGNMMNTHAGARDNRALAARHDVLTYTTAPLAADLEVLGAPRLTLYVRSSLPHTDFFGRLCDVAPDGRALNVCDGLVRIKPGQGERQPDGSLRVAIDLWPTAYRFLRGHRVRLLVSSGAHPRWARNLGTDEPPATATRIAVAHQTLFHDREHPSLLILPCAPAPARAHVTQAVRAAADDPTPPVPLGPLQTSAMGVGAWAWGDRFYWNYGRGYAGDDVRAAFEASLAAGITLFDTAEVYGLGRSEELLGQCLRETEAPALIASKFYPFPWRQRRVDVLSALRASLKRLGRPQLDLYQIHWPAGATDRWVEALADAVEAGLVRAVGVSNFDEIQMHRAYDLLARRDIPLASNQVHYSLLYRVPERDGVLQACRELGVTLIAYSPLEMGLLTGKYTPERLPDNWLRRRHLRVTPERLEQIQPLVDLLRATGAAHGKTPAQVALNWLICKGAVPIPGAKNARQAQDNAGALGWRLAEAEVAALDEASEGLDGGLQID